MEGGFIFFLTFVAKNSIYESHCDFFYRKISMVGEPLNEERNEEGCCEEKGSTEEEKVSNRPW
jgi:hypothetical protein